MYIGGCVQIDKIARNLIFMAYTGMHVCRMSVLNCTGDNVSSWFSAVQNSVED